MTVDELIEQIRAAKQVPGIGAAYRLAEEAVIAHPNSAKLWACVATIRLWTGRLDEAQEALNKALAIDSDEPIAQAAAGEIYTFLGDFNLAGQHVEKALTMNPNDANVLSTAVGYYILLNNIPQSDELAKKLRELHSNDPPALAQYISFLFFAERPNEAKQVISLLLERFHNSPASLILRAQILKLTGDLVQAEELLNRAIEIAPESDKVWAELASTLLLADQLIDAENAAAKALAINSRCQLACETMATIEAKKGDVHSHDDWQKRAEEAAPFMRYVGPLAKATELIREGDIKSGTAVLRKALDIENPVSRRVIGTGLINAYLMQARFDKARELVEKIKLRSTVTPDLLKCEATVHEAHGEWDIALECYQMAISLSSDVKTYYDGLIRTYHGLGQEEKVQETINNAFTAPPDTLEECISTVLALNQIGHKDTAIELLALYKQRFPFVTSFNMLETSLKFDSELKTGDGFLKWLHDKIQRLFHRH
jgi:tetratricopeptide (TPR) repeat protein